MSDLRICDSCGSHVVQAACRCPHCGHSKCSRPNISMMGAAVLLGLTGCVGDAHPIDTGDGFHDTGGIQPMYGVAMLDADEDGYFAGADDCDDADASVHPGAAETVGDGVDSNCDGADDT
jgi:hypothetical protein